MNKKNKAIKLFRSGYSCSQSVLMSFAGESDDNARAASAFGGGMGRLQKTCGAVTGAYLWFGIAYGVPGVPSAEEKNRVYERVREFNRLFVERNGTDLCSELLGEDLTSGEGRKNIKRLGLSEKICEKCISDTVDIIEMLK
jgi:C_GCAxxG_C_C family probable redox protein